MNILTKVDGYGSKRLEFGNLTHIAIAKKGARIASLLEQDYQKAVWSDKSEGHDCNCEFCDERGDKKDICPQCEGETFEDIEDFVFESWHSQEKTRVTRHFCKGCDTEVRF